MSRYEANEEENAPRRRSSSSSRDVRSREGYEPPRRRSSGRTATSDDASGRSASDSRQGGRRRYAQADQSGSANRRSAASSDMSSRERFVQGESGRTARRAVPSSSERQSRRSEADSYRRRGSLAPTRQETPYRQRQASPSRADYEIRSQRSHAQHDAGGGKKPLAIIIVAVLIVALLAGVFVVRHMGSAGLSGSSSTSGSGVTAAAETDALPTPYIAESAGIKLHSAVAARSLTEILIHNASYDYASAITTQLTEATNTEVMANHGTGRDTADQPTGDEWLTGYFIRCYRSGNAGPTMSAIDCGGAVGTTVYAPVTGKVVKVKEYDLYDNPNYKDIQIHIQPEGHSELDVVLIHLTDATVKEGDTVTGGVTPIAKIRDVYAYIGESMQLKSYTAEGDNGNHTHIQVNDATNPNYHGLD